MSVGQGSSGAHAPPAGAQNAAGITYTTVDESYFEARRLKRHARVWSLWALGVGAVISGHYSGWNLGLANGFGAMFFATIIIAIMYLGLTFSLAEMSPALPHTGGAYSFARTSMGPWAGYITGIAENIEFVLTPAVIVFFISSYLGTIFETSPAFQPVYWVLFYAQYGAGWRGTAERQRTLPPDGRQQHSGVASLRGVAVPGHRATAARGGGIA
jgi:ethanolamine permease